jgi:YVTN family beta-propeller protein
MYSNNRKGSRAACAGGLMALFAVMLVMGLGAMAPPADAAPFAYIVNGGGTDGGTVSVIDTATNTVVATVKVGLNSDGVAVTPDGKQAYVANQNTNNVSVIDTSSNSVVATVPVGSNPTWVAVAPDGKHAYITVELRQRVSVIETATNTVVATVPVGFFPLNIAVTPDGKHAYVGGFGPNSVSVIDTASNTVVATIPGLSPKGSPSPRTENTLMLRVECPIAFQ